MNTKTDSEENDSMSEMSIMDDDGESNDSMNDIGAANSMDSSELKSENQSDYWRSGMNKVVGCDILTGVDKIFDGDFQDKVQQQFQQLNELIQDENIDDEAHSQEAMESQKRDLFGNLALRAD